MKRRVARENAFILIFESLFLDIGASELIESSKIGDKIKINSYSKQLVCGVIENRDEIINKVRPFLKNWKIDRISGVLLAILEIALYEILYVDDVDAPVAINEAVELAKKYFGGDGPAFVNGVLGGFVKSI